MGVAVEFIFTAEKDPDWSSRTIMRGMGTDYSHVAIVLDGEIYHADDKGVCIDPLDPFLVTHNIVARKIVPLDCSADGFRMYVRRARGTEYSQIQLTAIGVMKFVPLGSIGRWIVRRIFRNGKSKSICSEWAGDVLNDLQSVYKLMGDPDWDWTPDYIFKVLEPEVSCD